MYQLSLHGDARFDIHVLKLLYPYGSKPKEFLLELEAIGWKENPLVRNPMMELPGCTQEFSVCMDSKVVNASILSKTKNLAKDIGATVQVLKAAPKGKF